MKSILITRQINAPVAFVFETIADIRNFSKANPKIAKIEFLTQQQLGEGTRFLETRTMNGREATIELEVTQYIENDLVRIVSDEGGTVWDTVFTVVDEGNSTKLEMMMEARPYKFLARMMCKLIRGSIVKAIETDMDAVKKYCEESS